MALAWLLGKGPIVAPVIGATRLEHLDDLSQAVELRLDPEICAALEEPYEPHAVTGFT